MPSGTVTFVFTDIEGSTKLFHELGDNYITVLEEHHAILRTAIEAHAGVEIKTEGDAFFVAFEGVAQAVLACRDAQLGLAAHPFSHGRPVRVRIGIHVGDVAIVDDDYVGLSVHEAARIAGAAHGGQILVSEDVVRAAGSIDGVAFHDLGRHVLKDFPDPRHLFQVTAAGLDSVFEAPRTLTARSHNLPASPTELIGRTSELREIQRVLVGGSRLVSITGGGGFGKSRLAIEAGWSLLSWFREGVWFVPLATVTEEADIVPTINRVLNIPDEPGSEPIELLVARLNKGPTLLVLDNLEQLGDGVVFIADLLAACPSLAVLATSRERLRLRGETELAIDGLQPDEALALFAERAEANNPCVPLDTPEQIAAMTELAAKLDGLPLALELAAARVRDEPPTALVGQLDRSLELLTEGERDLPARQRTLRSTIAWSHDLLDTDERRTFELLALFAGGVPLPAFAAVARAVGVDDAGIEIVLDRLVDKALVRKAEVRGPHDPRRWWLLETIRQFAAERLSGREEHLRIGRAAHARWFAEWMADGAPSLDQATRFDLVARDIDNLRLALAAETGGRARLAANLSPFWEVRGHWHEGLRWLSSVIGTSDDERCLVLLARARLQHRLRMFGDAEGALRQALMLGEDPSLISRCASELASVVLSLASEEGQHDELAIDEIDRPAQRMDEAKRLLDIAATKAASAHDGGAEARARSMLAPLLLDGGDAQAGRDTAHAALELFSDLGDLVGISDVAFTLARADLALQDFPTAVDDCSLGIEHAQLTGDRSREGNLRWIESVARFNLGQIQDAFAAAESAYDLFVGNGDEAAAAGICFVRGELAKAAGDIDGARLWMTRSADAWRALGDERRAAWCEEAVAQLELAS